MTQDQLRQGIALAKQGRLMEAKHLLGQAVRENPHSVRGWLWLAGVVETREQRRYCLERVLQLDPHNEAAQRALTHITSETAQPRATTVPRSHTEPAEEDGTGFAAIVARVFAPLNYQVYYTGKCANLDLNSESLLLKTCQEIFEADVSVFDLSSVNYDGYLEMGIALGLNRPLVAAIHEGDPLPPVLREKAVIVYTDLSDLEAKLSAFCDQSLPFPTQPTPDYCHFCGHICESMSVPPDDNSYLVLNESRLLWRGLMQSLTPHLAGHHLYPVYLSDQSASSTLCDMRRQVLASRFALCHLGTLSNESSFLALGMSIGSQAPWIILAQAGQETAVPSALRETERIEYATLADLEERLTDALGQFLGRIASRPAARSDTKTSLLSLPFWVQLKDWITHVTVTPGVQERETSQATVRVAHYRGPECTAKYAVPERGLLFGRGPDCDVVVDNQSASHHHFRILRGRSGGYFVEDLHSKNGTFLNGVRLPAGQRVEIHKHDTIRIPGAKLLIWDDLPLPMEKTAQTFGDTSMLPPILQIEIPDVSPPAYLSTWNHPTILTILLPDGRNRSMFEVQAYYPMGKILARLVELLDLPDQEYCFTLENRHVDNDETPLSLGIKREDVLSMVLKE
ncbi:MAG: hypothetical protein DRI48_08280 [Chloroflexi bacterium]|nr:MAG: hypothetical protein DRI48_08280 [Chloroflexota bacterium]